MLQRPLYHSSIALLSLLALAGGIALVFAQGGPDAVVITPPDATPTAQEQGAAPRETALSDNLIDINAASATALETLPGIGPVLSERIVAYREANGQFVRVDQLMAVSGIGPATYESLRALITVGD